MFARLPVAVGNPLVSVWLGRVELSDDETVLVSTVDLIVSPNTLRSTPLVKTAVGRSSSNLLCRSLVC